MITTVCRTSLDEWSARRRDNTQLTPLTTDRHPYPGGIRTHNLNRRAALDGAATGSGKRPLLPLNTQSETGCVNIELTELNHHTVQWGLLSTSNETSDPTEGENFLNYWETANKKLYHEISSLLWGVPRVLLCSSNGEAKAPQPGVPVQSQGSSWGFCGGLCGKKAGFYLNISIYSPIFINPYLSITMNGSIWPLFYSN